MFEQLLFLKTINPNINIIIDTTIERSNYNYNNNTIYLNNLSVETFFHELTHLLSRAYSRFEVPNEFVEFKTKFLSSPDNKGLMIKFLALCEKEKLKSYEKKDFLNNNINGISIDSTLRQSKPTQIGIIDYIEDIIDAIYNGKPQENIVKPIPSNYKINFGQSGLQGLNTTAGYIIEPKYIVGIINKKEKKIEYNPKYYDYGRFNIEDEIIKGTIKR